jgi:hypothetical protein
MPAPRLPVRAGGHRLSGSIPSVHQPLSELMNDPWLKRWVFAFRTALWALALNALAWALLLPASQLHAQEKHDHGKPSGFMDYLQEYGLTIQIVAGVVLVVGIALFIFMRMSKGGQDKDTKPPGAGESQAPK